MQKEISTEVKLHLPSNPLDDTPLGETEDTRKEGDPEDKQSEKKDSALGATVKFGSSTASCKLVKNPLQNLWADEQKSIRQN